MVAKIIMIDDNDNNKEVATRCIYPLQEYKDDYGTLYNFAFGYRQSNSEVMNNDSQTVNKQT